MVKDMIRIDQTTWRALWPSAIWIGLWMMELAGAAYLVEEWKDHQMAVELGLADRLAGGFYVKSLYALCAFAAVALAVTGWVCLKRLEEGMEALRSSRRAEAEAVKTPAVDCSPDAFAALQVDKVHGKMFYGWSVHDVPPRVALLLEGLLRKEGHTLSVEEFDGLFQSSPDEKEHGCSKSKRRNIKYYVRKALEDTPFDVTNDASGNFCLIYGP